ncbi:MAG: Phosphate metabolism transcription protein [Sclerophora amabilis]|nr:MAG: Phosphate metabolism transcription protein [Sclerophora amabilis]
MRFEKTLKNSTYDPWRTHYIDYTRLKELLREKDNALDESGEAEDEWTENDEGAFVEELVNVQLEKVNSFQVEMSKQLRERTTKCETNLERLVPPADRKEDLPEDQYDTSLSDEERQEKLTEALHDLDGITKETNELVKFSRINFTGFLKAGKKHDRKRGRIYRVQPLLQVRLGALPFNSEDYSPLLYRLSAMYSFVRQNSRRDSYGGSKGVADDQTDEQTNGEKYTSHKFWVHPDNLLEVKTYILRRLPVLVYNPQTSKVAEGARTDPTITSLYFDNPRFSLYARKVERAADASSLRLRWYGQLSQKPEIFFEKKTIKEGDRSDETRFPIKDKYVQPFINGEYKMEKSVQKLQDRQGQSSQRLEQLEKSVEEIQSFITENELQPLLRANYTRTAFQIPGDNRVRISLDTDLALIREDSLDADRPCRDPQEWHRGDIDAAEMEFPFSGIRKGEIARFPHAVLEIKIRQEASRNYSEWVSDLMSSHLLKEAPRFSKFVHGVAHLFEDYVNSFPFWLSEVDQDIRKDPEVAFEEEQEKKAKRAEDEFAVGSLIGSKGSPAPKPVIGSPVGRSPMQATSSPKNPGSNAKSSSPSWKQKAGGLADVTVEEDDSDEDGTRQTRSEEVSNQPTETNTFRSLLPIFSNSKYARAHRNDHAPLPPGVRHPGALIKDSGPVKVEAKVWLANQRTFIKWQHVSILLATLSLGLYNAAGAMNNVARALAIVYTIIALFAAGWGWYMYILRSRLIKERSGRDFDNAVGPVMICIALVVALCLNFGFKVSAPPPD